MSKTKLPTAIYSKCNSVEKIMDIIFQGTLPNFSARGFFGTCAFRHGDFSARARFGTETFWHGDFRHLEFSWLGFLNTQKLFTPFFGLVDIDKDLRLVLENI